MVVAADAVGVCKVGVGKAQLPDLCIHLCHAVGDGPAAEILRQQVGAVVGTGHLGGIQCIGQRHLFALLQGDVAGIGAGQRMDILVAHGELHAIPAALRLFAGKGQGHHLGDGGRMQFFVHVLLGQHKAGVRVDDAVRLRGRQRRARGPRHGCKHRADPEQHRAKHGDLFFHLVISPLVI